MRKRDRNTGNNIKPREEKRREKKNCLKQLSTQRSSVTACPAAAAAAAIFPPLWPCFSFLALSLPVSPFALWLERSRCVVRSKGPLWSFPFLLFWYRSSYVSCRVWLLFLLLFLPSRCCCCCWWCRDVFLSAYVLFSAVLPVFSHLSLPVTTMVPWSWSSLSGGFVVFFFAVCCCCCCRLKFF